MEGLAVVASVNIPLEPRSLLRLTYVQWHSELAPHAFLLAPFVPESKWRAQSKWAPRRLNNGWSAEANAGLKGNTYHWMLVLYVKLHGAKTWQKQAHELQLQVQWRKIKYFCSIS